MPQSAIILKILQYLILYTVIFFIKVAIDSLSVEADYFFQKIFFLHWTRKVGKFYQYGHISMFQFFLLENQSFEFSRQGQNGRRFTFSRLLHRKLSDVALYTGILIGQKYERIILFLFFLDF